MKVLLFYKNTTHAGHFLKHHRSHFHTLDRVETFLKRKKIKFTKACRGRAVDFKSHGLIITVGGDGTLLEAARQMGKQTILGINSDPAWSVGRFCHGHPRNFQRLLEKVLEGQAAIKQFPRLRLSLNNHPSIDVLNDILICHKNPAAMSRYSLTIVKQREEHRSSGIWIATAAGSSGGIHSAGGKILLPESKSYQYKPRELYKGRGTRYLLKGGILNPGQKITVTSLMHQGVVCVDGSHLCYPFAFNAQLSITHSLNPLHIVF